MQRANKKQTHKLTLYIVFAREPPTQPNPTPLYHPTPPRAVIIIIVVVVAVVVATIIIIIIIKPRSATELLLK